MRTTITLLVSNLVSKTPLQRKSWKLKLRLFKETECRSGVLGTGSQNTLIQIRHFTVASPNAVYLTPSTMKYVFKYSTASSTLQIPYWVSGSSIIHRPKQLKLRTPISIYTSVPGYCSQGQLSYYSKSSIPLSLIVSQHMDTPCTRFGPVKMSTTLSDEADQQHPNALRIY